MWHFGITFTQCSMLYAYLNKNVIKIFKKNTMSKTLNFVKSYGIKIIT